MKPRIAPFDGTAIHISSTNQRSRFGTMFRIALVSGAIPHGSALKYMGNGWFATTLAPDTLALFCERAGFTLTDMTLLTAANE